MLKEILENLQGQSDDKKRVWLIVFSLAAVFLVVFLWLGYFNNLVFSLSHPQSDQVAEAEKSEDFSFWMTMKSGVASIADFFGNIVSNIFSGFNQSKEYIIEP